MHHKALLFAAAVFASITTNAHATMRISGDPGGLIIAYAERFLQARASGEQVVIDGACLSACTLALAMLPRDQVCATSNAVLGFHAAWRPTRSGGKATSSVATQAMMELYPSDVRSWIGRHGGLTPRMIFLRGQELSSMVPACGTNPGKAAPPAQLASVNRASREAGAVARANRVAKSPQSRARFAAQQTR
jgi:hypothetical protein